MRKPKHAVEHACFPSIWFNHSLGTMHLTGAIGPPCNGRSVTKLQDVFQVVYRACLTWVNGNPSFNGNTCEEPSRAKMAAASSTKLTCHGSFQSLNHGVINLQGNFGWGWVFIKLRCVGRRGRQMRLTTVANPAADGVVKWNALTRFHLRPTARHEGERWVIPPILERCSAFSFKGFMTLHPIE